MKQIKYMLISFSIILAAVISSVATAQTNTIEFSDIGSYYNPKKIECQFNIYLDDKLVKAEDYKLRFVNQSYGIDVTHQIGESFIVYLDYDQAYKFEISHKGYAKKTMEIVTIAPKKRWNIECNIYLYSDDKDSYAGKLAYNEVLQTFSKKL